MIVYHGSVQIVENRMYFILIDRSISEKVFMSPLLRNRLRDGQGVKQISMRRVGELSASMRCRKICRNLRLRDLMKIYMNGLILFAIAGMADGYMNNMM